MIVLLSPQKFFRSFLLLPTILFLGIASANSQPARPMSGWSDETILARVGDKKISVREFLERSELTIRPNNFKSKSTALNNLISEKILALEAGHDSKILQNPGFQGTLKGIKEQLMREKLYYEVAFKKVKLDSNEVRNAYKLSTREYELEFYTIHHKELAQRIEAVLDSVPELGDEMFKEVEEILGKRPVHKVSYKEPEDDVIHEALFTKPLHPGAMVGPLRLDKGDYLVMKVLNWVDYPLISGEDQQVRWKKVQEKIHQTKARKLWQSYQANVMKGKRIVFDKQSFKVLSNWAMEKYLSSEKNDSLNFRMTEILPTNPEIDLGLPFFTLDNRSWTVDDFKKELMSHPLVFRTTDIDSNNFREQFKLAIVDMMRDHYLTLEAYKKSLDKSEEIRKTVEMWKDAFLAVDQERSIINSALEQGIIHGDDKPGILKYWTSHLHTLQKKYSGMIQINHDEFDKISLTNVDMFAWRPGAPYPVVVPEFPVFISSGNLDDLTPSLTLP